ncbi:hypothetical protein BGX38DRAFT_1141397 [Terfezia claveryi]|nr:hypothetical protein BGX38DRAFT_1141397 [Terfezia claveryi]
MRNNRLLWTLVFLITFVGLTASAQEVDGLIRRADEKSSESIRVRSTTATDNPTPTTGDGTITPGPTETGGSTSIRIRTTSESIRTRATTTRVAPNSPPGGINMVTPAVTDGFPLYPIGTQITWSYNYTSLLISPTAINVEAFCSRTQQYYTIAQNYSVAQRTVVWDTEEYQRTGRPLIAQETYTLYMYDSATQKTDMPQAGKLVTFRTFQFAMYSPRGNIPLNEYKCPTCSDAIALLQTHSVRVLLGTSFLVVVGFTWFIYGVM